MVVNMYKRMGKVVIKILQGSAVTLTMLQCICAKNYENCLAVDKVIAKINYQAYFFGLPCILVIPYTVAQTTSFYSL